MFKFMKSKKGFSLVELMIVVVIMAILVAVAVPIYNAVTANARTKTCLDNQRTIINSISNNLMLNGTQIPLAGEEFTITTNSDGDGAVYGGITENTDKVNEALLKKVFQTIPYCPVAGSVITVTITPATKKVDGQDVLDKDGAATVSTTCKDSGGTLTPDHVLVAES